MVPLLYPANIPKIIPINALIKKAGMVTIIDILRYLNTNSEMDFTSNVDKIPPS
ncbi:hypothetical protein NW062_04020 [Mycoplasmopsis cynos]|nr:hypothetical protein NW062_04020 [Mycoplasmopsis cynos]